MPASRDGAGRSASRRWIVGAIGMLAFVASAPQPVSAAPARACHVTLKQYHAVTQGMNLAAVTHAFGCHGRRGIRVVFGNRVRQIYRWQGKGTFGANIDLTFMDGRLTDKSQLGLR